MPTIPLNKNAYIGKNFEWMQMLFYSVAVCARKCVFLQKICRDASE